MQLPVPTAADYLWQFQRLLPRGRIWHRGWGTLQAQYLITLMPMWSHLHGRANNLLVDAFPCSTLELLPEWEASLGLPDPCIGELTTIQQRQDAVCTKFKARGGQSIAYFEALATSLGYRVGITQYAPFRASINRAGDRLYNEEWAYHWKLTVYAQQNQTITYFRASRSTAGEPLRAWGDKVLECLISAAAPAHTTIAFAYAVESFWDRGASIWDGGASRWDVSEGAPLVAETMDTLLMRLPASVRRAFLDRAASEGKRPAELLAAMLEEPW